MFKTWQPCLVLVFSFGVACAAASRELSRDTTAYSFWNPNLSYKHYWSEASNVYKDLSSFKRLYVRYHNCAWSTMSSGVGGRQYYDDDSGAGVSAGCSGNANENTNKAKNSYYSETYYANENTNNAKNNYYSKTYYDVGYYKYSKNNTKSSDSLMRCGNQASSCDQWWGGMQPCYGANVAYSLYGVLPGDNPFTSPCTRHTFINSFFTRDGLNSFLQASNGEVDTTSVPEYCSTNNGGYGSTATCSSDGTFTLSTFNGACLAQNYLATTDTLDSLNEGLNNMQCVLIYDGSKTDYATELLSQSVQCSFDRNNCPDPYGLVRKYEFNLFMASSVAGKYVAPDVDAHAWAKQLAAVGFLLAGLTLIGVRVRSLCGRKVRNVDLRRNLYSVSA